MAVVRDFSSRGKRGRKALSAGIEGLLSAGVRGSIDVPEVFVFMVVARRLVSSIFWFLHMM